MENQTIPALQPCLVSVLTDKVMRVLANPERHWNGFAMPCIYAEDISILLSIVNKDREQPYMELIEGNALRINYTQDYVNDGDTIINPELINEVLCYDLGNEGICFEIEKTRADMPMQFIVTDKSGRSNKPYPMHLVQVQSLNDQEEQEDIEELKEWLQECASGDEFEQNNIKILAL